MRQKNQNRFKKENDTSYPRRSVRFSSNFRTQIVLDNEEDERGHSNVQK